MFYIQQDNKIVLFDEDKQKLQDTIAFMPQYEGLEIKEVEEGYVIYDFELMTVEEMEEKEAQKERERLDKLSMTRGDVFRGLLLAKGLTRVQLRQQLEVMPTSTQEDIVKRELALIDFDEALDFYRGNPLIDTVGLALGITSHQLDKFFDTNDYRYLTTCKLKVNAIPEEAVIELNSEIQSEITVPYGSTVDIVVSCEGYISRKDVLTLTEDRTLEVVLDEDTTGSDTTDVSDEVDTAADTAEEADADNAG